MAFACAVAIMRYFYPRPPRGGRPINVIALPSLQAFLSTPSARRATMINVSQVIQTSISIHALREEGDSKNREKIPAFGLV